MSGIYASLRQAKILILEILNVWMPVPLYLSGVVKPDLKFGRLPLFKVRDLRLDIEQTETF